MNCRRTISLSFELENRGAWRKWASRLESAVPDWGSFFLRDLSQMLSWGCLQSQQVLGFCVPLPGKAVPEREAQACGVV